MELTCHVQAEVKSSGDYIIMYSMGRRRCLLWADPTLAGQDAEVSLLPSRSSLSPLSEASGPISPHSTASRPVQCAGALEGTWPGPPLGYQEA